MAEVRVVDLPSISLEQFTGNDSFIIVDDGKITVKVNENE